MTGPGCTPRDRLMSEVMRERMHQKNALTWENKKRVTILEGNVHYISLPE